MEGSTRGGGDEGELVTHNIAAFRNVPLSIPFKEHLELSGKGFIHKSDFERLKDTLIGSDGKPYRNARNLASGSIRCLDAGICKEREISFFAFNILEGMDGFGDIKDSRSLLLLSMTDYGFGICPFVPIPAGATAEEIEKQIQNLQELAEISDIPIDGMVLRYDSLSYSASLGWAGHHYNDGIAFKFEDDTYETIFWSIEWQTGRSGEIAPVALFDTVDIDGCEVSRASLHNLTFIKNLELHPGCRILVSKRNYNDGIAFKFEDDTYETIFWSIEWQTGRSGEIAPVALFDTVDIDGCEVSRASLHNLTFIKNLELHPGCRILVSKRNMIIPHVEENLDRGNYQDMAPQICPCCGQPTRTYSRVGDKGRIVETLHCDNPECGNRVLQRFVHFAEKKVINIRGLSEATLDQLIQLGALKNYQDLYHLDRYCDEIIALEGFREKSYENLIASINESRSTTFVRFVVAMDIPLIGRTASRILDCHFHGDLQKLRLAALDRFDFTCLEGIGDIMSSNLYKWFRNSDHLLLWSNLQKKLHFENGLDAEASGEENNMNRTNNNTFAGCTIVATGKLENFTRDGINAKIISLGATPGSSVTKKTDYLICGEKAGSKLAKAQQLGVKILTEQEFLEMLSA